MDLFLSEFVTEAKSYVEKIEAAFLDVDALAGDPQAINSVFRAAHSLKGTASFFSLEKIVTIAHELESLFLQIKDGKLTLNDNIIDIVLQSIDFLNALIINVSDDSTIYTKDVIRGLRKFSFVEKPREIKTNINRTPFDLNNEETKTILEKSIRHGHKGYAITIGYNEDLGRYYSNPREMIDNICSVGTIAKATITAAGETNGKSLIINNEKPDQLTETIIDALSDNGASPLDLLVTSILDLDLFSIAIEIDKSCIFRI